MSYEVYKSIHFLALVMTFLALGGLILQFALNKGEKSDYHRLLMIGHGLGLSLILFSGFGLISKLGLHNFPMWLIGKAIVWLSLGGVVVLCRKRFRKPVSVSLSILILAGVAIILAVAKPL